MELPWAVKAIITFIILGIYAETLGKKFPDMSIPKLSFIVLIATATTYNVLRIMCV